MMMMMMMTMMMMFIHITPPKLFLSLSLAISHALSHFVTSYRKGGSRVADAVAGGVLNPATRQGR